MSLACGLLSPPANRMIKAVPQFPQHSQVGQSRLGGLEAALGMALLRMPVASSALARLPMGSMRVQAIAGSFSGG